MSRDELGHIQILVQTCLTYPVRNLSLRTANHKQPTHSLLWNVVTNLEYTSSEHHMQSISHYWSLVALERCPSSTPPKPSVLVAYPRILRVNEISFTLYHARIIPSSDGIDCVITRACRTKVQRFCYILYQYKQMYKCLIFKGPVHSKVIFYKAIGVLLYVFWILQ